MDDSSRIEDLLECPICLERLDERSRVLPCQHTICLSCLGIIVESKGHLQCPECRTSYANLSIEKLPRNVLLVRLLEGIRNSKRSLTKASKRLSAKVKYEALSNQPCARGLYNFISSEEGDLSFNKGDVVTLLREIDDNWWEGGLNGKRGSIPKNFVETLIPLPKIEDDLIKAPFAKALYSYESKDESEIISFREGDIIGVIKKVDDKWLEGILAGQYGIFPLNFIQLNRAAKEVMSGNGSSGATSGSNSDEEPESLKTESKSYKNVVYMKQHSIPLATCEQTDNAPKRNTIHIENPSEKGLSKNLKLIDSEVRARTQSVNARVLLEQSESHTTSITTNSTTTNCSQYYLQTPNEQFQLTNPSISLNCSSTTSVSNKSDPFSTCSITSSPSSDIYVALFTYSPSKDDELALIQGDQYHVIEKHLDGWFRGMHMRSKQTGVFPGNYVKLSSQLNPLVYTTNAVGYSSNPASPTQINNVPIFNFPLTTSNDNSSEVLGASAVDSPSGSPSRNGMSGILKILKKNKSKRNHHSLPQPPCFPTQTTPFPPSYYHSSMPAPPHHRLSRPMPLVPAEPPPPYTPLSESIMFQTINEQTPASLPYNGEKFQAVATYPAANAEELSFCVGDIIYVITKKKDGWYKGMSARTGSIGLFPSNFVKVCS
ncbi:E3 ubiquitin-protein ligase SH3RF3 isoform X1 [Hydra vulgaris]|uniref:E3 ubiquitin-protein ligase SH3RF3 isoform X1 n=1 Tax=Hydra vulgaris TaxID=6087 RepID=A0ABM4D3E1_HYDVU